MRLIACERREQERTLGACRVPIASVRVSTSSASAAPRSAPRARPHVQSPVSVRHNGASAPALRATSVWRLDRDQALEIPERGSGGRCSRPPQEAFLSGEILAAEGGPPDAGWVRRGASFGDEQREAVQQQVSQPRRARGRGRRAPPAETSCSWRSVGLTANMAEPRASR